MKPVPKTCPILSTQCLEGECAFYCELRDAEGYPVGGSCSVALIPQALVNLANALVDDTQDNPERE